MVGETGSPDLETLRQEVRRLRRGQMVRLNVSGDYLLPSGTPDHEYIDVTNTIPPYVTVISYSHAWRRLDPKWFRDHVRPNASCDTLLDVVAARAAGWSTVIVDADGSIPGTKIADSLAVSCPFETKGIQCITCGLCSRTKRPSTVVFQVHGARKRVAAAALVASQPGAAAA